MDKKGAENAAVFCARGQLRNRKFRICKKQLIPAEIYAIVNANILNYSAPGYSK